MANNIRPKRTTILQFMVLIPIVEVALRLFGIKRTWLIVSSFMPEARWSYESADREARANLSALVRAKTKSPIKGRCLSRSILLWWQLKRRRLSSTVFIGVRKKQAFKAHAWVEYEGVPLNADKRVHRNYTSIGHFSAPEEMT